MPCWRSATATCVKTGPEPSISRAVNCLSHLLREVAARANRNEGGRLNYLPLRPGPSRIDTSPTGCRARKLDKGTERFESGRGEGGGADEHQFCRPHTPGIPAARPGDRRNPGGGHRHRSPSALRQDSPAEPARLAAHSDRPPSSDGRDRQTDRAEPHRDPGSTSSLPRSKTTATVSDSSKASKRCRPCDEGMSLCAVWSLATDLSWPTRPRAPSPLPWSPGSRPEQGRLTVDPRSVIAPFICLSHTWHRTTSRTPAQA